MATLTATYNDVGFSYPARAVILYPAAQNYYIVQDKLGSVHGLFQRDGTWRAGVRFNPYGDLVALDSAGPKPPIWYSWTGREFDEETGWYYHRARYYSPLVRRFVQEDPIGYEGGVNLYAYVEGQALEATDPGGTRTSEKGPNSSGGMWLGGRGGIDWGTRSTSGLGGWGRAGGGIIDFDNNDIDDFQEFSNYAWGWTLFSAQGGTMDQYHWLTFSIEHGFINDQSRAEVEEAVYFGRLDPRHMAGNFYAETRPENRHIQLNTRRMWSDNNPQHFAFLLAHESFHLKQMIRGERYCSLSVAICSPLVSWLRCITLVADVTIGELL